MTTHTSLLTTAALVLLASACTEPAPSAPKTTPPTQVLGFINGAISGNTMTTTFVPLAGSIAGVTDSKISPAIYGQQGVTIDVLGVVDSLHNVVGVGPAGSRTWFTHVELRNRQAFPIGSNYGQAVAPDTSGVFAFFTVAPNVSRPSPCVGCAVSVSNQSGTANFTAASQKYFYYPNRPSAYTGGAAGKDTTNRIVWLFKTSSWNPGVTDTVHAFFFTLMVSAAWPPPQDSALKITYDGTLDSLPDLDAKPLWKTFASTGDPTLGVATFTAGSELRLTAGTANTSLYYSRHDSLGTSSAFMDARLRVVTVSNGTIQAVFGLAEPQGSARKQEFVGIASNQVSFATYNNASGKWTARGATAAVTGTSFHNYRLRKIGTTSATICVDGVAVLTRNYAPPGGMQNTQNQFANTTTVFGSDGFAAGGDSRWTSVLYTIGSDGGGCT